MYLILILYHKIQILCASQHSLQLLVRAGIKTQYTEKKMYTAVFIIFYLLYFFSAVQYFVVAVFPVLFKSSVTVEYNTFISADLSELSLTFICRNVLH